MGLGSLYSRIAIVFATVLIAFGTLLGWLSYSAAKDHQYEVMQQLSRELAGHIASQGPLLGPSGLDRDGIKRLFLMASTVNPTIEVYLLGADGVILSHSAPDPLAIDRVSLPPIRAFLAGAPLPIFGDSPRVAGRREIFSVAPIAINSRTSGYFYIVLVGDMYRQMADQARQDYVLRTAAWTGAAALGLALLVGLAAFARITQPLNRLARSVLTFENGDFTGQTRSPGRAAARDEIGRLESAFARMSGQLAAQMTELKRQDNLRRELVAGVSHDLRTPLTSMQSFLETLLRMGESLPAAERRRYLQVAVRQSQRVAKLAQQLFELARLECEETQPQPEVFSVAEVLQDIAQKFALAAEDKGARLITRADPEGLFARADIGMIERVITNLIDNAIRHTPAGGEISLEAVRTADRVEVRVVDTGSGIAAEHLPALLKRNSPGQNFSRANGGLGLRIAARMLALHGTRMAVTSEQGRGATFSFALPAS